MPVSDWKISGGRIAYDNTIAPTNPDGSAAPFLHTGDHSLIPVSSELVYIERRDDEDRGFSHGAIRAACYFNPGSSFDMRGMIQSLTLGGYYFARVFQVTGGRVAVYIGSCQPFVGSLTDPIALAWTFKLSPLTFIASGLALHDPFYVQFEWEAAPEPVDDQARPFVKLDVRYGLTAATMLEVACATADFSVFPTAVPGARAVLYSENRVYGMEWSIAPVGLYTLGPPLFEQSVFGAGKGIPYPTNKACHVFRYEHYPPLLMLAPSLVGLESWEAPSLSVALVIFEGWPQLNEPTESWESNQVQLPEYRAITNYHTW